MTLAAAAVLTVVFVPGSSAVLTGGTTFEGNDGNLTVDNATGTSCAPSSCTDWASFVNGSGLPNGTPAPDGLHRGIDDPSRTSDNSFGQGTKEDNADVTAVQGSIPPQKSDLARFYEASELVNSNVYLYLAWERSNVLGSANMDFEINQNATTGFNGTPRAVLESSPEVSALSLRRVAAP